MILILLKVLYYKNNNVNYPRCIDCEKEFDKRQNIRIIIVSLP